MFMLLLGIVCVLFLVVVNLMSQNIVVWWSTFLMMTILFSLMVKSDYDYSSIVNYFIIQEFLGLMFLVLSYSFVQFFVVMLKIGVSPLHFWVFSVSNGLGSSMIMWFLTFQKIPFLPVLVQLFVLLDFLILIVGLFVCFIQLFNIKSYKNMMILSSTESLNWILIMLVLSMLNVVFFFIYYFFIMMLLMPYFSKLSDGFMNWEVIFVFLNLPLSATFFIKIFSLSEVLLVNSWFFLFILFFMFLSVFSLSMWLVNVSTELVSSLVHNNKMMFFYVMPIMLAVMI